MNFSKVAEERESSKLMEWGPESMQNFVAVDHFRRVCANSKSRAETSLNRTMSRMSDEEEEEVWSVGMDMLEGGKEEEKEKEEEEDRRTSSSEYRRGLFEDKVEVWRRRMKFERINSQALLIDILDPPSFNMADVYDFSVFTEKRKELEQLRMSEATRLEEDELDADELNSVHFLKSAPVDNEEEEEDTSSNGNALPSPCSARKSSRTPKIFRGLFRKITRNASIPLSDPSTPR